MAQREGPEEKAPTLRKVDKEGNDGTRPPWMTNIYLATIRIWIWWECARLCANELGIDHAAADEYLRKHSTDPKIFTPYVRRAYDGFETKFGFFEDLYLSFRKEGEKPFNFQGFRNIEFYNYSKHTKRTTSVKEAKRFRQKMSNRHPHNHPVLRFLVTSCETLFHARLNSEILQTDIDLYIGKAWKEHGPTSKTKPKIVKEEPMPNERKLFA